MSKNKSYIDSVKVGSPCSEDWKQMRGSDKIRFCSHCSKSVNNLSEMTRKEAMRLVRNSGGSLCIRYIPNPVTQRPMFAPQLAQITRRAPTIAAGVMTATLAMSTQAYTQGGVDFSQVLKVERSADRPSTPTPDVEPNVEASGNLSGTITDSAGALVPNVSVCLKNTETNERRNTATNEEGIYQFKALETGTYYLETTATAGFSAKTIEGVKILDGKDSLQDFSLEVEFASVTVGGIGAIEYSNPLSTAVDNDDVELARELIINGEDVNGKDENYDKITPLFIAAENGNIEMVTLLLDFGAKVNARDGDKQTPLMRLDDDATPELIELLVRHGAKLNLTDKDGNTALILALDDDLKAPSVKALIDAGADVRIANKEGMTALMHAANNNDLESVKLLVAAGSDINARDEEGENAWDKTSEDEIEEFLKSHGSETSPEDDLPETSTPS